MGRVRNLAIRLAKAEERIASASLAASTALELAAPKSGPRIGDRRFQASVGEAGKIVVAIQQWKRGLNHRWFGDADGYWGDVSVHEGTTLEVAYAKAEKALAALERAERIEKLRGQLEGVEPR